MDVLFAISPAPPPSRGAACLLVTRPPVFWEALGVIELAA